MFNSLDDVVKRDVFSIMQPLELIAHVLEQQPILLWIGFESTLQQSQYKFHLKRTMVSLRVIDEFVLTD